ncbi:MAG: ABC transporter ATP-binding protein [Oscillospiraceae bacterium]
MNAIEIRGLCKSYGSFALKDIDLTLPEGCVMGLVGENGAGKSTTIKLIMNALRRDAGRVTVLGMDNQSPGFTALKNQIGVVLDEACFPEVITVKNVDAVMRRTYENWDSGAFAGYVSRFDLPERKPFKDFSRGMKMKLAIAVALSHAPRLLILDEATGGLDPMVRDEILDIFNDFTREPGHSILMSSHIVSDLEKICDYIAFLHKGRLLLCESKDALLEQYALLRLPAERVADIPPEAVVSLRTGPYGAELLVRRALVSPAFPCEHTSIEDIILAIIRGEEAK